MGNHTMSKIVAATCLILFVSGLAALPVDAAGQEIVDVRIIDIEGGCMLASDGDVYCRLDALTAIDPLSEDIKDQVGNTSVARRVEGLSGIVDIASGSPAPDCAVDTAGDVWCWGYLGNYPDQVGVANGSSLQTYLAVPTKIEGIPPLRSIDVTNGSRSTSTACGIGFDDNVHCWNVTGVDYSSVDPDHLTYVLDEDSGLYVVSVVIGGVPDLVVESAQAISGLPPMADVVLPPRRYDIPESEARIGCGIDLDGGSWCWPYDNETHYAPYRVETPGFSATTLVTDGQVVCATNDAAENTCWAHNDLSFHLDDFADIPLARSTDVVLPARAQGLVELSYESGSDFRLGTACGIGSDGFVLCWGDINLTWGLDPFPGDVVIPITDVPNVVAMAMNHNYDFCLVDGDGRVHCRDVQAPSAPWLVNWYTFVRGTNFDLTVDIAAPFVTGAAVDQPNSAGWYNEPVEIRWNAVDPEPSSGLVATEATTTADLLGTHVYTSPQFCDNAGNCAASTVSLAIDTEAPSIEFRGARESYGPGDVVNIECEMSDAVAGIDLSRSRCPSTTVDAGSLGIGTFELEAIAVDLAGNETNARLTYSIVPDTDELLGLIEQSIDGPGARGIRHALTSKIVNGEYEDFIDQVNALCCAPAKGKRLPEASASELIRYAELLLESQS